MFKIHFKKYRQAKLSKHEIAAFCNQLRILLSSGTPFLDSLRIIEDLNKKQALGSVIQQVTDGAPLAVALQGLFPPMVVSTIKGAEKAGDLEGALGDLSKYYEERAEVESKLKSALVYPAFVIGLSFLSLIVLFLFVLPGFKSLFLDLGTEIPLFTQLLIGFGDVCSRFWYVPLLLGFIVGGGISKFSRTEQGKLKIDSLQLKISPIAREQMIQSFRTLGSLLSAGIAISDSLNTTLDAIKNSAFQAIFTKIKTMVEDGQKLSQALSPHAIFPKAAVQMVAVGEDSGNLSEMLLGIADFYEKERETFIKRFTTLLEPSLTLIVGLVVGLIALAMFLPMVNMISQLQ